MNRQQRQVEQQLLANEKEALKILERNYAKALADVKARIRGMMADDLTQSKIYQLEYQKNLERQITAILDVLKTDNVQTVNDYLKLCYEDGFIGNLYGLSGDDLEMILPIDQRQMAESVTRPTEEIKVSERLYSDVNTLQKDIQATMSRGLAQNMNYKDMAVQLALCSEASLKRAYRIIRTEGGRVQSEAKLDAMQAALDKGADLVRQWDATMDKKTRKSHVQLDGQIRNPGEPFEVNGHSAMAPRLFGIASEDVNCRCTLLTRPRWAVGGERLKWDQDARESVSTGDDGYKEWKDRYKERLIKTTSEKEIAALITGMDMTKASKDDIINLGKLVNEKYEVGRAVGDKERLKEIFGTFRAIGGEVPASQWAKGSEKKAKERLNGAFSCYPKDWLQLLKQNNKQIYSGMNKRGFFSPALVDKRGKLKSLASGSIKDYVTIHLSDRVTTPYHEIGHLVEFFSPDLVKIEKEFIESRTKGETETQLKTLFPGFGYGAREKTKPDNFISPYIGKSYMDATEVLSMGLESLFEPGNGMLQRIDKNGKRIYKKITDDEEFLNLIIGLILKG